MRWRGVAGWFFHDPTQKNLKTSVDFVPTHSTYSRSSKTKSHSSEAGVMPKQKALEDTGKYVTILLRLVL
jgi:hypothetical protein